MPAPDTIPVSKRPKLPQNVKLALVAFMLSGSFVVAAFPSLVSSKTAAPPFMLFLATGLAMVVLTCALFAYLGTLGLGFGKTALTLALGYNVVIALIKIVISPYALYLSNQRTGGFDATTADPNTAFFYVVTAILVLLLYVVAFRILYRHFVKRFQKQQGQEATPSTHRGLKASAGILILGLVGIFATGGVILIIPVFLVGSSLSYFGYIFGVLAGPLVIALALAIYLAYRSFAAVEQQALATGNATLLASFFWFGLSLILLYHIMWIVFMVTLVNIWPFSTYTSK